MIHMTAVGFELYNINKVEVVRQYHNIDIMVIVNDGFRILIESKTNSKQHNDQLARYYKFAKQQQDWSGFCLVYLKTGNESQYHINKNWENLKKISPFGYASISREMLLNRFNRYKHIKNDIFQAYFEHLQAIQNRSDAYLTLPIKDWDHYCWQGFFMLLETSHANPIWWDYVDNKMAVFGRLIGVNHSGKGIKLLWLFIKLAWCLAFSLMMKTFVLKNAMNLAIIYYPKPMHFQKSTLFHFTFLALPNLVRVDL
ncbi:MAG: PD-(D/E)XK nuclease family protein [Moraxella sp.]|nr:PD-(D/E)XK nuclease family protein [Moraxella sp.]